MREEKTALKSCSSPLALLSFPKLLTPFAFSRKGSFFVGIASDVDAEIFWTEKCVSIFLGSRTVSLSRSSGETLAVQRTELSIKKREEKTALKSCSSPLALLSFPKLLTPFAFSRKGSK